MELDQRMMMHVECGKVQTLLESLNYFRQLNISSETNATIFLIKNQVTTLLHGIHTDLGNFITQRFSTLNSQYIQVRNLLFQWVRYGNHQKIA